MTSIKRSLFCEVVCLRHSWSTFPCQVIYFSVPSDFSNTIGWFRVLSEYEGQGLGRAILSEILKDAQYPIYLHTQPTSARAIKLYSDFGFKLITNQVGYRNNDLTESLPYLQKILPEDDYKKLQFTEANDELIKAALSSDISEF